MTVHRRVLLRACCWLICAATTSVTYAQTQPRQPYPSRPVRFVVPFGTGGAADLIARLFAQKLAESLGQPFVIDNRTGAGGIVGAEIGARSAPDGYTLVVGSFGTHTANPSLHAKLSYDPVRDFTPISLIALVPTMLVVHPTVPAKSVADLIALAKAKPRVLNYASSGTGTGTHLAGELFKNLASIDMVHVPYKSAGTAISDLVAGHVQLMYSTLPSALPLVKAGKLRALGVTTAKRLEVIPDVPAIGETLKGYEVSTWFGVFGPAGTPRPIVSVLASEIAKIAAMPDVRERLVGLGAEPIGSNPEEFGRYIRAELPKWAKVIKAANIKPD